jgi:glycosyltransferase involved in cell wall biosynthesis
MSQDFVSVVIPCYNEERFILKALQQLVNQYDRDRYEILVVDGLSSDRTRGLIEGFQRDNPEVSVRIVDNPARNIPTALNLGIAASRGDIIARMDAHAVPSTGYIRRCVEVLSETDAAIVGAPCRVQPGAPTLMARAIAFAVSHPLGIGDAKYRLGKAGPLQEPVDTVAFASFRRSVWDDLGGFNERLLANEDYDFNYRIRQSGRKVILDRREHCDYFARTTLRALATQYCRYGSWKAEMVRLNPSSIRLRHLAAPLFVLSLALLAALGFVWQTAWWILLAEVGMYLLAGFAAGTQAMLRTKSSPLIVPLMPLVFATIQLTWGVSFLIRLSGLPVNRP